MILEDRTDELFNLHHRYLAPKNEPVQRPPTRGRCHLLEEEVIEKASNAKNGAKFLALWSGDWKSLGYPSQSEADQALCIILAFWCNGEADYIDSVFRQSGLMRPKWDENRGRQTYGEKTIAKAIASTPRGYNPEEPETEPETQRYPPTDLANARRFVNEHGQEFRYVPAWKNG